MIDTDKYEGHTEGPWEVTESRNIAVASDGYGLMSVEMIMNVKDLVLMADAPLPLAEVKRLRQVMIYVEQRQPHPALEMALKQGLYLSEIRERIE